MNWNLPRWVPLTNFFFKVFFRLKKIFFRNKKFFSKGQLLFSFLCIIMQKKISERSKKIFFENLLTNFRKKKIFKEQLLFSFLCIVKQKKNFGVIWKFLKIFDLPKSLSKLGPTVEDFNSSWSWLLRGSPFTLW